jgi:hypothetical protein
MRSGARDARPQGEGDPARPPETLTVPGHPRLRRSLFQSVRFLRGASLAASSAR